MAEERCWSLQFDGGRCAEPAVPSTHFCAEHSTRGGGGNPLAIWRAPLGEMPPDLVAAIRRAAPEATFPAPAPVVVVDAPPPDSVVTPALHGETGPGALDWLLSSLRQTIAEVIAVQPARTDHGSDLRETLQKANTVTRLSALYLKTHQAAAQDQANQQLLQRVAELEQRLAAVETLSNDRQAPVDESVPDVLLQAEESSTTPGAAEEAARVDGPSLAEWLDTAPSPTGPPEAPDPDQAVERQSRLTQTTIALPARASP
jgi:hypothetical protein